MLLEIMYKFFCKVTYSKKIWDWYFGKVTFPFT